jgi:glutathione S-transferase
MALPLFPAVDTCLALLVYLVTIGGVSRARSRTGIDAPAVTGNPEFERYFRIQQNTLEQLVLFLPSLWLFALALSPLWAGLLGLVFVAGRVLYARSYARDATKRGPGFIIGFGAAVLLLLGGIIGVVYRLLTGVPA